jgi:integrase
MGLEIQRGRSKWWYCRVTINGHYICQNLGVLIRGTIPEKLTDLGDEAFERSRFMAKAAMDKFLASLDARASEEELIQKVHVIRTGSRIKSIPLSEMFKEWKELPRRREPSRRYLETTASVFARFTTFLKKNYPNVNMASDILPDMARAYLKSEAARGISPKTYNNNLIFVRSCFEALHTEAGLVKNPFEGIPTKEEETIFRKPFSSAELAAITEAAKGDPFIYPIIITGMCTAMRRGDCCMLKWESVDLRRKFITVKTSKTGETVKIPIFPLFEDVLRNTPNEGSEFVFPQQAAMYEVNPDGITLRVRKVLELAGFADLEDNEAGAKDADGGGNLPALASRGEFHQERKKGLRRASIRDFHSFRVTWVTLALTAGVPMELVQRVTGHRTAQIVEKHYFQPKDDDFRKALSSRMPSLVSGQKQENEQLTREELRERIEGVTAKNWEEVRRELLERL